MTWKDARLLDLRHKLTLWTETMRRATHARAVELIPHAASGFVLTARWNEGDRPRTLSRTFTCESVFGSGDACRRACDYARDFIREVLRARGVLT